MRNTRDVDDDISREAAKLLRRVIEAVAKGELEARTPDARALLRRLEGALIALEASSPKGESEHVMIWLYVNRGFSVLSFEGGVRQEQSTLTAGPSFIGRHEEGVSGRIDLGARLWTWADGLHRRHNKGRPGITPEHRVPGLARSTLAP
jgi:hypothetical protein